MANYAQAALLTAQAKLNKKYTEAEMRRKVRPAVALAFKNTDYAFPDAAALRVSDARPVEVHYKTRKTAGSGTTKATRHTGSKGDSAKVTLSWNRLVETFSFSHTMLMNKVIGAQEAFNNEVEQALQNLQDRLEIEALTYFFANRAQLDLSGQESGTGTWDTVNKALKIDAAEAQYFIQNVKTFMYGRHYREGLDIIADLLLFPKLERVANQGAGNEKNTAFQFGNTNIMPTTDAMNTSITSGQALIMPAGYIAALPWNDPLNREGYGRPNDYIGMLTTMADPFGLGIRYDVSVWSDRNDSTSVNGGHVQDIKDEYEIAVTYAFGLPLISTPNDSIVHSVYQSPS